jgi:hypothetical protein
MNHSFFNYLNMTLPLEPSSGMRGLQIKELRKSRVHCTYMLHIQRIDDHWAKLGGEAPILFYKPNVQLLKI